jgi:hypothetical protein
MFLSPIETFERRVPERREDWKHSFQGGCTGGSVRSSWHRIFADRQSHAALGATLKVRPLPP